MIFHDFVHFQPFLQVCRVLLMDFMFGLQILLFTPTLHFLRKSMESCEMYWECLCEAYASGMNYPKCQQTCNFRLVKRADVHSNRIQPDKKNHRSTRPWIGRPGALFENVDLKSVSRGTYGLRWKLLRTRSSLPRGPTKHGRDWDRPDQRLVQGGLLLCMPRVYADC